MISKYLNIYILLGFYSVDLLKIKQRPTSLEDPGRIEQQFLSSDIMLIFEGWWLSKNH